MSVTRGPFRKWTFTEDLVIKCMYPDKGSAGCQEYGVNRTVDAITKRASKLGVAWLPPAKARSEAPRDFLPMGEPDRTVSLRWQV